MKKIIYIFLSVSLLFGCVAKKEVANNNNLTTNEPAIIQNTVEEEPYIEYESRKNNRVGLQQYNLDDMGLSKPASLREIGSQLTDDNRNNITFISIYNGENIDTLDGIELFPALESLDIYNSQIKNLKDIQGKYLKIRSLFIESSEMEDVSNIVFLENLVTLYLIGSDKIKYFPDITHLKKLRSLSLSNSKGINFNNLAEKLPLGIKIIHLNECNIESLNDIANLFKTNITHFDLSGNLVRKIDFDVDYGAAAYIYMTGCPMDENYFKWNEPGHEESPKRIRNAKDVLFDFGYFEDYMWVIDE